MKKHNIRRWVLLTVWFLIAVILQHTLLSNSNGSFISLNLPLFFPVFAGILAGPTGGLMAGIILGLFQDILLGKYIGLNILCFGLTGFVAGRLALNVYKETYLVPVLSMLAGTVFYQVCYLFGMFIIGVGAPNWWSWCVYVFFMALGNAILAPFIYVPVYHSFASGWLSSTNLDGS